MRRICVIWVIRVKNANAIVQRFNCSSISNRYAFSRTPLGSNEIGEAALRPLYKTSFFFQIAGERIGLSIMWRDTESNSLDMARRLHGESRPGNWTSWRTCLTRALIEVLMSKPDIRLGLEFRDTRFLDIIPIMWLLHPSWKCTEGLNGTIMKICWFKLSF